MKRKRARQRAVATRSKRLRAAPPPVRPARHVPDELARRILEAVVIIPRGRVATYGWIAERAGLPRRARLVGHVLSRNTYPASVPWHRVINAQGRISLPRGSDGHMRQRSKLESEGVVFIGGRVNLRKYGWQLTLDELLWKVHP